VPPPNKKNQTFRKREKNSLIHYCPAMPFGNRKKNILEDLFSYFLLQFKKYPPSENLVFNNLGIFQNLKLRN